MNAQATPSALRWLIGVELKAHRGDRRASASAALLNCAESKISHMEAGRYKQSPDEVSALMAFYGADQTAADRLVALAAMDDESTWWAPFADVVPDWLATFVGLERLADAEFTFGPQVLTGLAHTESYSTEITTASKRVRPDRAARLVEFRLARQGRLDPTVERPLELTAVVEESALRRPIGSSAVRREQYVHLLDRMEQPNFHLHVLPQSLPLHAGLAGGFSLLRFNGVRPIVFVELSDGGLYLQKPNEIASYTMTAESLIKDALDRKATRSLITSLIDELR